MCRFRASRSNPLAISSDFILFYPIFSKISVSVYIVSNIPCHDFWVQPTWCNLQYTWCPGNGDSYIRIGMHHQIVLNAPSSQFILPQIHMFCCFITPHFGCETHMHWSVNDNYQAGNKSLYWVGFQCINHHLWAANHCLRMIPPL